MGKSNCVFVGRMLPVAGEISNVQMVVMLMSSKIRSGHLQRPLVPFACCVR